MQSCRGFGAHILGILLVAEWESKKARKVYVGVYLGMEKLKLIYY